MHCHHRQCDAPRGGNAKEPFNNANKFHFAAFSQEMTEKRFNCRAWLGILIFGSDFWDPNWKRNFDSVFDSEDSGQNFFLKFCC
jgi:hypothetical protein